MLAEFDAWLCLAGTRVTERATSLPGRLPTPSAPQQEEEDEGYVIISREATASPSTSSHGRSGPCILPFTQLMGPSRTYGVFLG
jgi:hypothetical protein